MSNSNKQETVMKKSHGKIAVKNLSDTCSLASPEPWSEAYELDSPATSLMVDFKKTRAITAGSYLTVNDALELMRSNKIRALMVIDSKGAFAGLISAMDLMGRKPMAYANEAGIPRSEVQVKDIMLAKTRLTAIARSDVESATLGEVLQVLVSLKEQHLLVVEGSGDDMQISACFQPRILNVP
jgi:CBS domain-containing protein